MKLALLGLAGVVAAMAVPYGDAEARSWKKRQGYDGYYGYQHSYRRPASVGANGLCQRDTGTPTSDLNFRNRCDVEEFWRRNMEQGSGRK